MNNTALLIFATFITHTIYPADKALLIEEHPRPVESKKCNQIKKPFWKAATCVGLLSTVALSTVIGLNRSTPQPITPPCPSPIPYPTPEPCPVPTPCPAPPFTKTDDIYRSKDLRIYGPCKGWDWIKITRVCQTKWGLETPAHRRFFANLCHSSPDAPVLVTVHDSNPVDPDGPPHPYSTMLFVRTGVDSDMRIISHGQLCAPLIDVSRGIDAMPEFKEEKTSLSPTNYTEKYHERMKTLRDARRRR
jgi:hypothetical protein